jgi:hypothetical protein
VIEMKPARRPSSRTRSQLTSRRGKVASASIADSSFVKAGERTGEQQKILLQIGGFGDVSKTAAR